MHDTTAPAQIERERTTLGLPEFAPEINQDARLATLRETRTARGIQGDFSLAPERRFTQQDRDDFLQSRLQEMGTPRAILMASQLRSQNTQSQLNEAQLNQQRFGQTIRAASALLDAGQEERAAAMLGGAFSLFEPSATQGVMVRNPDGTYEARAMAADGSVIGSRPFANLGQALNRAQRYLSEENVRFFAGLDAQREEGERNRRNSREVAGIGAGATVRAAEIRARTEADQIAANAPLRRSQIDRYDAEARRITSDIDADDRTQQRISEFVRLSMEDPFNPALSRLRTEITASARNPERLEVKLDVRNADGVVTGQRVENRLDRMLADARQSLTPGESAAGLLRHIPEDARAAAVERIRRDAEARAPGSFERDILPRIREYVPRSSGAAAPAARPDASVGATPSRPATPQPNPGTAAFPGGLPVRPPAASYDSGQPVPQRRQGSHEVPGSTPRPQGGLPVAPGFSRTNEDILRFLDETRGEAR
jgi:hypothetical protein